MILSDQRARKGLLACVLYTDLNKKSYINSVIFNTIGIKRLPFSRYLRFFFSEGPPFPTYSLPVL